MTRVAFALIGGSNWTGGYNYIINLLRVIRARRSDALQPVLLLSHNVDALEAHPFYEIPGLEIVKSPVLNADRRAFSLIKSILLGADPSMRRLLIEQRIDVVFENACFYGARIGVPAIAWIPDFQHRFLPHLFSHVAWWKRDLGFRTQIAAGRTVMLSSFDSLNSCERFYPAAVGRAHVVRFAVMSSHRPDATEVRSVRDIYGLPKRYFYFPSQFWQHKNHLLVIDALSILKKAGHSITVVASGKEKDPYRLAHIDQIRDRIETAGIAGQFRSLGLVPYAHIAPLMVGSVAVLNPSLFEGWSTTVEEARALNVPMVLSDLAVHQEQAAGIARFFDRYSAESLAAVLLNVWHSKAVVGAKKSLNTQHVDLVQRFADDFVDLVNHVALKRPRKEKAHS